MPGIEWAIIGAITGSGIPSSMVAQNVGAGRRERVAAIARAGVLYSFLLTGASVLAVEILDVRVFGRVSATGLAIAIHW